MPRALPHFVACILSSLHWRGAAGTRPVIPSHFPCFAREGLVFGCVQTPITKKESESGSGNGLSFAVSSMQGWRSSMEDSHTAAADIPELPGCSFFAVFDGHAGSFMSKSWCVLDLRRPRHCVHRVVLHVCAPPLQLLARSEARGGAHGP